MDFMDPNVSVHEMKEKLVRRIPVSEKVMNDEVRSYEPTENDIYLTLPDGRYENQIWHNLELREKEAKKLSEFNEWLKKNDLRLPKGLDVEPENIRILTNREFNFQETYDLMWKYDKDHRTRILPVLRDYEKRLD